MQKKQVLLHNTEIYHYFDINTSSKNVLLLLHGNFSGSQFFDTFMEQLPKDIRILAPDMRGFGDSSYYQRFSSLKELAHDLEMFLDILNIPSITVLGWSLGGGVAMELAAMSSRVNKLILVNATTHKGYPLYKKDLQGKPLVGQVYASKDEMRLDPVQVAPVELTLKNQFYDGIKYLYDTIIFTNKKPTPEEEKRWYQEALKQRNIVDADWALANQNMSHEDSHYAKAEKTIDQIQVPTLHFWGTDDKTTPESMIQDNIQAIKNSKYIKYESCGHSPFIDQTESLIKEIQTFILG